MSESDPRAELTGLANGLRAHLERLRGRGRRRVPGADRPAADPRPTAVQAAAGDLPTRNGPEAPLTEPARARSVGSTEPEPNNLRQTSKSAEPADRQSGQALDSPPTAAVARAAPDLESLERTVAGCEACGLCRSRTRTVFADGRGSARVMFVGEAPGAEEDRQGVPFVGRAGQLLSDIITKGMGLRRPEDVYIANVLKCRPPDNRDPTLEEKRHCTPFLERQIELVDPELIVPLGRHAAQHVLSSDAPMGRLRGRVHRLGGRAVVPTYHPAYLLRSPNMKRATWEDIQLALAELGLPIPPTARSRRPEQG